MNTYRYLRLYTSGDHLYVQSTAHETLKELTKEFAQRPRSLAPQGRQGKEYGISEYNRIVFTHLKEHVDNVYWWALQALCESGWEPFAVIPYAAREGEIHFSSLSQIHLRKEN